MRINLDEMITVPAWLIPGSEPLFFAALPIEYVKDGQFSSYADGFKSLEEAERLCNEKITAGWPVFGVVTVSEHGGRVIESTRNKDPKTSRFQGDEDYASW